ncbi:MAG: hypothetical protein SVR08_04525 [Spirochaetota bacterium]|nr:hypothetical protein [Spirochaetota bacterium]
MQKIRLALLQKSPGISITRKDADELRSYKPHFICFPEYFFVNKNFGDHKQTDHNFKRQLQRIETLSRSLIADKNGIILRVAPNQEETAMIIKKEVYI